MLYYFSRLKDIFLQRLVPRGSNKIVDDLRSALHYPPDLVRAEDLLSEVLMDSKVASKGLSLLTKNDIRSLRYNHLIWLHKFYNSNLYIRKATIVFHEILRRDSMKRRIFLRHGLKRFLMANILFCGLTDAARLPPLLYKFYLILLFLLTNKSRSKNQSRLVINRAAVVIGGAADHGDLSKISRECEIVCGVNRLEIYDLPCHVSYYRGEALMEIERKDEFGAFRNTSAFISAKLPLVKDKLPVGRAALTTNIDLATSYGTLNAVPTICLDLIRYGIKKIKLVCVDFNLGDWGKDYIPVHSTVVSKALIFGQHPAPLQFLIIKSLSNYYDIQLASNPYIRLEDSYRYFISLFARQCKTFGTGV